MTTAAALINSSGDRGCCWQAARDGKLHVMVLCCACSARLGLYFARPCVYPSSVLRCTVQCPVCVLLGPVMFCQDQCAFLN